MGKIKDFKLVNINSKYFFAIIIFLYANLFFFSCKEDKPVVIDTQIPEIIGISNNEVFIGDELIIYGKNFGLVSENSRLVLEKDNFNPQKDTLITLYSDLCSDWSYTTIRFKMPNNFVSGYLAVFVNNLISNKIHIIVNNLPNLEVIEVPAGSFIMGSENGWENEQPQHTINISKKLYVAKYETDQYLWTKIMKFNPSIYRSENLPIHNITWFDAIKFCNKISKIFNLDTCYTFISDSIILWNKDKNGFRLPTEAEWEYACRSGSNSDFPFAKTPDEIAWFNENSAFTPHPLGLKKANAFGLYDMQGNVWEWCWDWYDNTFYHYSPSKDPIGPGIGIKHVIRGGAANSGKAFIRVSNRTFPDSNYKYCGLRLVRTKIN